MWIPHSSPCLSQNTSVSTGGSVYSTLVGEREHGFWLDRRGIFWLTVAGCADMAWWQRCSNPSSVRYSGDVMGTAMLWYMCILVVRKTCWHSVQTAGQSYDTKWLKFMYVITMHLTKNLILISVCVCVCVCVCVWRKRAKKCCKMIESRIKKISVDRKRFFFFFF